MEEHTKPRISRRRMIKIAEPGQTVIFDIDRGWIQPGDYGPDSGGFDQLVLGTLRYAK